MPTRRPPPLPPKEDPTPPPIPSRPGATRGGNPSKPPVPPEAAPPALPKRNHPVAKEEVEEFYEEMAPIIINVNPKPKGGNSAVPPPSHQPRVPTALEEAETEYEIPLEFQVSLGQNMNANANVSVVTHHSDIGHQSFGQTVDDDPGDNYEAGDGWSDEDWSDTEDTTRQPDDMHDIGDVYELPEENMPPWQKEENAYVKEDPVTPVAQPEQKPMLFNPADIQIGRLNLTSPTNKTAPDSLAKSPTPAPPTDLTATIDTPTTNSSVISNFKKMFEQRALAGKSGGNKPKPPPKPRAEKPGTANRTTPPPPPQKPSQSSSSSSSLTPSTATATTTSTPTTTTTTPVKSALMPPLNNGATTNGLQSTTDNERNRNSNSDDNSSSGSLASGGQLSDVRKTPILPNSAMTPTKRDKFELPATANQSPMKPTRSVESNPVEDLVDECGAIYDEGISLSEDYYKFDWFHGDVSRGEGERRLATIGKIGTFLIRKSSNKPTAKDGNSYPYTLVIQAKSEVKNMRIRQRPDMSYVLGTMARADEISFPTLDEMVEHHKACPVKIFAQQSGQEQMIQLSQTPKKF